MYLRYGTLGLLLASLVSLCPLGMAQSHYEPVGGSRSLYFDRSVHDPETSSGVWETPDGKGGAVGLDLELTTALPNKTVRIAWKPQRWRGLVVGVFDRSGPEVKVGDVNFFTDSARGGGEVRR